MKTILTLCSSLLLSSSLFAQDFAFGKLSAEEINMRKYAKDSTANAVVLKEFGTARVITSSYDNSDVIRFDYHVRIKIFNSKAFDEANITIPLYKNGTEEETIEKIKAVTYNMSGETQESELDPKKVYSENSSKYLNLKKFTLPNLHDGCIIEYTYTLNSPYIRNFRSWEFQSNIPKIYSEYIAFLPGMYNYNVLLKGPYKLSKSTAVLEKDCYTPGGGYKADCSKMTYAMADIPAFEVEEHMTAPKNFKSAINFELSDVRMFTGGTRSYTRNWKDVDQELKSSDMFGSEMRRKDLFKERLQPILVGKTDSLEKAKLVYNYIKSQLKWNHYYGKYSEGPIRKTLENRSGSVGEINIALIAALSAAGLDAEAVILSTRENGVISKLYPVVTEFNYVVAKVNIGAESYLLDATDPLLGFGMLPLRCINDQGRVISLNKPSYWIDMKASQKEKRQYALDVELTDKGKLKGILICNSLGYAAYNKRTSIKKFNTIGEYVENLDESMPGIKILNSTISNVDSTDLMLQERYELEFDLFDNIDKKQQLFFNPFLVERVSKNPFKLNDRTYPVDMGAMIDQRVVIHFKIPANFEVASTPKNTAMALPDNGGRFVVNTSVDNDYLTCTQMFQLNKPIYSPDDYGALKELYNQLIQIQKTEIVLKKK